MEIEFTVKDKYLIVKPYGEIDHHTSMDLRQRIDRAFNRGGHVRNLIFDFSCVEFMDSSGIGILIGRYKELAKSGGKVYAINISGEIGRIFGISGLARIIPCYDNLEDIIVNAGGGRY